MRHGSTRAGGRMVATLAAIGTSYRMGWIRPTEDTHAVERGHLPTVEAAADTHDDVIEPAIRIAVHGEVVRVEMPMGWMSLLILPTQQARQFHRIANESLVCAHRTTS